MKFLLLPGLLLLLLATWLPASADDILLTPGNPVQLTGTKGKFDFIKVDAARRRLLACHTGNASLDIIDLDTGKLITSVPTGDAQGVAIDDKNGRYFVSCSKPPQLMIVNAAKLLITGGVPLSSPADVCTYSADLNRVVVDNDDKPEQWWIDPDAQKIKTTVNYTGKGMEDLAFVYDDASAEDVLVQNLKDANQIAVFHYKAYTSTMVSGQLAFHDAKYFPTTPTSGPHGLAMVPESNEVLIAGGNGKLVTFDLTTHKITASCDIAPKVDEIAYDPGLDRVYCASGTGAISVAYVSVGHLAPLGDVPSAPGAHSIAVDPKTHTVWIAYVKNTTPCVQPFTAK